MKVSNGVTRRTKRQHRWGIVFSLPSELFLISFMIIPIICAFALALTSWDGIGKIEFVGLQNFIQIFKDGTFYKAILNNFKFMLLGVPVWTITPLIIAALLYEEIKGFSFFRSVYLFPTVLSASIIGIIFKTLFSLRGPVNAIISAIIPGFQAVDWLGAAGTSIPLIVMVINWAGFGSAVLIFLSAMASIDESLYESARLDGAGWWARFFYITIPMIHEVLIFSIVLNVIDSFTKLFNYIFVMTNGGPGYETYVMELLIYNKAFTANQMGYACALAVVMFAVVMVLVGLFKVIGNKTRKL